MTERWLKVILLSVFFEDRFTQSQLVNSYDGKRDYNLTNILELHEHCSSMMRERERIEKKFAKQLCASSPSRDPRKR